MPATLEDTEFLREYVVESIRIRGIDAVMNALDEARKAAGISKADVARAINAEPATIRQLFASSARNPTLGTLAEVAAALGMRTTVEALAPAERTKITRVLLEGRSTDTEALARYPLEHAIPA